MNIENVNKAIAIMTRVKGLNYPFDMETWQGYDAVDDDVELSTLGFLKMFNSMGCVYKAIANEADLHRCGTGACFGGWVAVSPEFKADGGGAYYADGAPRLEHTDGMVYHDAEAIAKWLDIPEHEAAVLTAVTNIGYAAYGRDTMEEITVDDVIEALTRLRDTGTCIKEGTDAG